MHFISQWYTDTPQVEYYRMIKVKNNDCPVAETLPYTFVYIDDIDGGSPLQLSANSTLELHYQLLRCIFTRFKVHKIRIAPRKLHLAEKSCTMLGWHLEVTHDSVESPYNSMRLLPKECCLDTVLKFDIPTS